MKDTVRKCKFWDLLHSKMTKINKKIYFKIIKSKCVITKMLSEVIC